MVYNRDFSSEELLEREEDQLEDNHEEYEEDSFEEELEERMERFEARLRLLSNAGLADLLGLPYLIQPKIEPIKKAIKIKGFKNLIVSSRSKANR